MMRTCGAFSLVASIAFIGLLPAHAVAAGVADGFNRADSPKLSTGGTPDLQWVEINEKKPGAPGPGVGGCKGWHPFTRRSERWKAERRSWRS